MAPDAPGAVIVDPAHARMLVRLPQELQALPADPLAGGIYASRIGCFERAQGHHVLRPSGGVDPLLLICLAGEGWVQRDATGERCRVVTGDAVWIDGRRPHAYGAAPHAPWSIAWTHLRGAQLAAWQQRLAREGRWQWRLADTPTAVAAFEALWHCLHAADAAYHASVACAAWLSAVDALPQPQPGRESAAERLAHRLREHLAANRTLADHARELGCSRSHLLASFRAHWGCPPRHYQIRLRLQRACVLLETTPWPVQAIAAEVGYDDALYFSRLFARHVGTSPTAWRQQHRQGSGNASPP
jgi:AraC-like DNA-binding protein